MTTAEPKFTWGPAYRETLKQIDRCLVYIERPEIQSLLLSGFSVQTMGEGAPYFCLSNGKTRAQIVLRLNPNLRLGQTKNTYHRLELARYHAASLLRILRNSNTVLSKQDLANNYGYGMTVHISVGQSTNSEAVKNRYERLWQKAKSRVRPVVIHWTDTQTKLLEVIQKNRIIMVKAGPRNLKKMLRAITVPYILVDVDRTSVLPEDVQTLLNSMVYEYKTSYSHNIHIKASVQNSTDMRIIFVAKRTKTLHNFISLQSGRLTGNPSRGHIPVLDRGKSVYSSSYY